MRPGEDGPRDGTDQYRGSNWGGSGSGERPPYGNSEFGGPAGSPFGGGPGGYAPPAVAPEVAAAAPAVKQGRPGLIVLTSFIVQFVLVAAVGNQWVTEKLTDFRNDHNDFVGILVSTPLNFAWRFTARDNDNIRLYQAQLVGLAVGFILAALLTLALVRGAITFGRAFFGIWLAVIAATLAGGMAGRAILKDTAFGAGGSTDARLVAIFYRGGAAEIPAGVGLGFVVALIAALVAVVSRHEVAKAIPLATALPEQAPEPEAPPPYYGEQGQAGPSDSRTMSMQKVQDSVSGAPDQPTRTGTPDRDDPYRRPDDGSFGAPLAAGAAGAGVVGAAAAHDRDDEQRAEDNSATQAIPVQNMQRDATPEPTREPEVPRDPEPAREPIPQPTPEPSPVTEPTPTPEQPEPTPTPEPTPIPDQPSAPDEPQATQALPVQPPEQAPPEQQPEQAPQEEQGQPDDRATQAFPIGNSDEQTVRRSDLPNFPPPGGSGQGEPNPTQQFPRPPDDEEMGQHPDHHTD